MADPTSTFLGLLIFPLLKIARRLKNEPEGYVAGVVHRGPFRVRVLRREHVSNQEDLPAKLGALTASIEAGEFSKRA